MGCWLMSRRSSVHARFTRSLLAALCLGLLAPPLLVHAQQADGYDAVRGDNAQTARSVYEQAMEHAAAERHQEAADLFERLLDTRWSMQIAYNHADALVHLGELLRASRLLKKVIREAEADATGSPASEQIRIVADMLLEQIEPQLGQLTVNVEGDELDVSVEIDGAKQDTPIGQPMAVDPGRHQVNLRRGRQSTDPTEVILGDELPLELTITLDASALGTPEMSGATSLRVGGDTAPGPRDHTAAVDSDPAAFGDGSDDNLLHQWWFWGSGAAVVVGAVVIIALAAGSGSDDVAGPPSTGSGVVVTALEMP